MSSADLQTVVIACPNCGTRYQVPYGTIGAAGREVQCAQCTRPWHAMADVPPPAAIEDDRLFTPADERALDEQFEAEARAAAPVLPSKLPMTPDHERTLAEIKAAIMPRARKEALNALDPAALTKSKRNFDKRQQSISSRLPLARVRRTARLAAFVLLAGILVLGFAMRVELVRWYPALAGLYSAMGLPINVVGLEFENSKTLMSFRNGKPVMLITARVRSVATRTVDVPPVLVGLLDTAGTTVYEWTVTLKAREMEPGEVIEFSTEVSAPPQGAQTVRLSFTTPRGTASAASAPVGTL
jgi:predicted Zn finger-like uncharacterized protein